MTLDFVQENFIIGQKSPDLSPQFVFYKRGFRLNGSSGGDWKDITIKGIGALTLVNAKANSLSSLKLFGGTEQRNLPKGHTQLEYVYMTSGSFIKIEDLLISSGYRIEYEFQTTTLGSSLRNYIGGRAPGVAAGGGFRLSKLASGGTALNRVVLYGFETGTEFYDPTTQFQPNTRYKYTYDNGVCTLESGGSVISTQTFAITDNTSTKWGINSYVSNNDYWQTDTDGVYGYSLKVWNPQGELVMDLVPDLTSSNVVCYYDMVTGNIREASAGTFEAGTIAPTPTTPVNIISNNGAIKYSANICNVNEQTALVGYYISSSGVVTADANNWIYQDFIPVKPNTTYTLTMSTSVYYVTISEYSTADDSGFITRKAGSSGDNTTLTITTGSNTNYIRFGTNIYRGEVTLNTVLAINWMLNVGDTMAYQPYVEGGIYTDGTTETVQITGKNLFDQATATRYQTSWSSSGGGSWQAVSSSSEAVTYGCYVEPNTTYTLSKKGGSRLIITGYITKTEPSSEQTTPADYKIKTDTTETIDGSYTFTTPADCTWILFGLRQNNASFTFPYDVQLELGSTATTYEPYYNGGSATAEMLLKVGDYQDVQSVIDGAVTRNVGIKVLDGTENWIKSSSNAFYLSNVIIDYSKTSFIPFCTHFNGQISTTTGSSQVQDLSVCFYAGTSVHKELYIRYNAITTVEQFKAWLADQYNAGTPVIIVYPLATATTETVTHQHLNIQAGTNTIAITQASIDNLGLEVSYKGTV